MNDLDSADVAAMVAAELADELHSPAFVHRVIARACAERGEMSPASRELLKAAVHRWEMHLRTRALGGATAVRNILRRPSPGPADPAESARIPLSVTADSGVEGPRTLTSLDLSVLCSPPEGAPNMANGR